MSANNGCVVLNYYLYRSEMWRSKRYVWIRRRASRIIINQWDYTRVTDREEIRSSVFCNFNNCGSTILHEFLFKILIRLCTLECTCDRTTLSTLYCFFLILNTYY